MPLAFIIRAQFNKCQDAIINKQLAQRSNRRRRFQYFYSVVVMMMSIDEWTWENLLGQSHHTKSERELRICRIQMSCRRSIARKKNCVWNIYESLHRSEGASADISQFIEDHTEIATTSGDDDDVTKLNRVFTFSHRHQHSTHNVLEWIEKHGKLGARTRRTDTRGNREWERHL